MSIPQPKQTAKNNDHSSCSSHQEEKAEQDCSLKQRRAKRKRSPIAYNCYECKDRLQCEDCHSKEIEKDLQLMHKLVANYNAKSLVRRKEKTKENKKKEASVKETSAK